MEKANIVFNLQFVTTEFCKTPLSMGGKKIQSVTTQDMFDYYDRDEACDKTEVNTKDENDDQDNNIKKGFDYYNYRIGSTGAFNKNGMLSREEYFKKTDKYKPKIIYRAVFSFVDEFAIDNDIKQADKMRELIKKTMDKNIKAMGFEIDNVEWTAFYHTNTNHPHVHLHFYEKEPKKRRYLIDEKRLKQVKSNITRLMKLNTDLYIDRDRTKENIINKFSELGLSKESRTLLINGENNSKKYFCNHDKKLTDGMLELEKVLPRTGSMKFNSSNIAPYKNQIIDLIEKLKEVPGVVNLLEDYSKHLDKEIDAQIILYGGSREDKNKVKFKEGRMEDVDTRIGNIILSNIKNYREDMKRFEDMIKSIEAEEGNLYKYYTQKSDSKQLHNIRTRINNIIAGIGREIGNSIQESHYIQEKMKHMVEDVNEKAKNEIKLNKGIVL